MMQVKRSMWVMRVMRGSAHRRFAMAPALALFVAAVLGAAAGSAPAQAPPPSPPPPSQALPAPTLPSHTSPSQASPSQAPSQPFMQYGLAPAQQGTASGSTAPGGMPSPFQRIGFDQKVGQRVPADLVFRDETGRTVRLGDYFGKRPVVLSLVYFGCPMLCPLTLNGLTRGLKRLSFDAGREFEVVVVSFDPRETPAMAAAAKREALKDYGRPETADGWHFLTGGAEPIRRLTQAVGFRYFYDSQVKQFAHAAGIVLLTSQGAASRYLYGIDFPVRNVRLGLVEAADNRIGSPVDQVLLYCFHYDPVQGRYSAATLNIVRLAALLSVAGLGLMIALLLRRERQGPNPLGTA